MKIDDEIKKMKKKEISLNNYEKLILVEYEAGKDGDDVKRNIYKIDSDHNIIWQIQPSKPPMFDNETFVYLNEEGGKVTSQNFSGEEFEIDLQTGEARFIDWHK